jgi:hypothetical protein
MSTLSGTSLILPLGFRGITGRFACFAVLNFYTHDGKGRHSGASLVVIRWEREALMCFPGWYPAEREVIMCFPG